VIAKDTILKYVRLSEIVKLAENIFTISPSALIDGGVLEGIINNQGKIQNVALAANTQISGGILAGSIVGDPNHIAQLKNTTINAGTNLFHVHLDKTVKFPKGVPMTITAKATVDGLTLQGEITNRGIMRNPRFDDETRVTGGGVLIGYISGTPNHTVLLEDVRIGQNSILTYVHLGENIILSDNVILGEGVTTDSTRSRPIQTTYLRAIRQGEGIILGDGVVWEGEVVDTPIITDDTINTVNIDDGATIDNTLTDTIDNSDTVTDNSNDIVGNNDVSSNEGIETDTTSTTITNTLLGEMDVAEVIMSQDESGTLFVEGTGKSTGINFTFMPSADKPIQLRDESPIDLSSTKGNFTIVTMPDKQQYKVIPTPKDMLTLAEILGSSHIDIGESGEVLAIIPTETDTPFYGVAIFNPLIEPISEDISIGIHTNGVDEARVVYPDNTAQRVYPTVLSPQVFIDEAYATFPNLNEITYNANGTFSAVYQGEDLIVEPTFGAEAEEFTEDEIVETSIIANGQEETVTYTVPYEYETEFEEEDETRAKKKRKTYLRMNFVLPVRCVNGEGLECLKQKEKR